MYLCICNVIKEEDILNRYKKFGLDNVWDNLVKQIQDSDNCSVCLNSLTKESLDQLLKSKL